MDEVNINDLLETEATATAAEPTPSTAVPLSVASAKTEEELDDKMREIELKNLEDLAQAKAGQMGLAYINLKGFPVSPEAIALITQDQAVSLRSVCFFYSGSEIRIGSLNPLNPQIKAVAQELAKMHHANLEIYLISQNSLDLALKIYDKLPKIRKNVKGVEITEDDLKKYEDVLTSFDVLQKEVDKVNISELFTLLIASAIKAAASDIHIEAEEKDIKIRFRLDGVLHTVAKIKPEEWDKIISRLKLISGLKLNITQAPQDGRFTIFLTGDKVEVRVSTIPTSYGESVVARILRSSSVGLKYEDLGLRGKSFVDLKHEVARPNGMIVSTGPTGSGKTTTLYAILNTLNSSETKIITLEDPIEYKLEGINQSQIDHAKDYTFAKGLRSILRQDPDIVMVGEIRDLETAEVAINAALTGHLVISTIHTNNAAGAIPRFLAMGVKPFLLSPALNAVIGQRLVRKICQQCKIEDRIDTDVMTKILNLLSKIPVSSSERLDDSELHNLKFYKGKGCAACHGLGFKGRIGIFEIMTLGPEIEKIILSGNVSENDIQDIAVKNGMVTMVQDGLLKAKDGITTVEEVFKVAD
ncbi:MAG: GspE/PulE family protein [Candidatus Komeilibacteria bacterium]|nr:GspE/PulE family protein [Candidatus Komeilibacteria bacterium]